MNELLAYYLAQPWTVRVDERFDDDHYFAATIDELPGFVATGNTTAELDASFWEALAAFLESYIEDGEDPPLPESDTESNTLRYTMPAEAA